MIFTAVGQRTPAISYISQEQIKDIGSTVDLQCSVLFAQDYPIVWIKVNKDGTQLPLASKTTLILRDSRYSLRYDDATSTYDIQETDAGFYVCRVIISQTIFIEESVELQVRRAPFISDNSTRSEVVSEGESVTFSCYAGGFPTPKISWRRQNNAMLPTGGLRFRGNVLKIHAVRKEDRGTYYCVADNGVGRGVKRHVNLEVEFAPVVTAPRPRLGQALQFDMDLECHVEAYPPPAISWLKDDVQLLDNQHQKISTFATADEYTDSTIRILTIEKRQYGEYVCEAANKLGTAKTTVELFETIIPVCPPACGQAQYGAGATATSSGTVVAVVLLMKTSVPNINYSGLLPATGFQGNASKWLITMSKQALAISSPKETNADVDPHSFYFDEFSKSDVAMESPTAMNTNRVLERCIRKYNDCVNNKDNEIPDESFSRQIINILLSHAGLKKNDDGHIGKIVIEISTGQLEKLKKFANGEATIRDTYFIIPKIFKKNEEITYGDMFSLIEHLCIEAIIHKDIILGFLVISYMTWIILTTKWNMLRLSGITLMIVLAASFIITWLQLIKEAEVQLTAKQMAFTKMPIHCQPDKMSMWDKVLTIFSSEDSCHKYFEAQMENPFLQVTPAQALSQMIGTCILQPLKLMGNILSDFAHHSTKHLSYPIKIILEPVLMLGALTVLMIMMYCLAGGSLGWALGPLSFFSFRRTGNSANNSHMKNEEKREPINVIFNINTPDNNQSHQFGIKTSTQSDDSRITPIEAEEVKNKLENTDTTSRIEKLTLHNPASGDSNLLNSLLPLEDNELINDSKIEKIEKESGSGDN
ncbi:hypothetical protein PV328_000716 [Microctonus aethiopoides]|uniref:Chloride channel CLIC-like protein 1 n=1 Tax=Microctonus aethiopoides TaxID=144406 RepID=A0AA39FVG2_9HYME|nr:hypothetical protein PV328_000716 [Microctonus aethiopoides]